MAVDVAYRSGGGAVAVGQFVTTIPDGLTITATPTVQDGQPFTISGTGFPGTGARVYLDETEIPVNTQSTTSITTLAVDITYLNLAVPSELYVVDGSGNESNRVTLTIQPQAGHKGYLITTVPAPDPSIRLEGDPDIEVGDEIEIRAVTGSSVTTANVNIDGSGATDVASDSGGTPDVASYEYRIKDQFERSLTWERVMWAGVADPTTTVPNVLGLMLDAATSLMTSAGLTVGATESAYSATYLAGQVSAQFPDAGAIVLLDSAVTLTISLGRAPLTVPDLTGYTTAEADLLLVSLGLTLGRVLRYIDGVHSGLILGQIVAAGTVLDAGAPVDVVVSSNLLPDVTGMLLLDAVNTLSDANLEVEDVTATMEYSADVPSGYVIRQNPLADTEVSPGATVVLVVSLGVNQDTVVTVPYLIGKTESTARARITSLMCVPDVVGSGGSVLAQSPAFMTQVDRGSTIQITMGGPLNQSKAIRYRGLPPYGTPDSSR